MQSNLVAANYFGVDLWTADLYVDTLKLELPVEVERLLVGFTILKYM